MKKSFRLPNLRDCCVPSLLKTAAYFLCSYALLGVFWNLGKRFASHQAVNHSAKEYVRGTAHTNTIEGYFSIFKRGMKGVYQHCTEDHLQRYLHEFDFRYNYRVKLGCSDMERADIALSGIAGKRLTYRRPDGAHA